MTYVFPDGTEISDELFEAIRDAVYRYYTGRISGYRFEKLMRRYGITRTMAYKFYRWIIEGKYVHVIEFQNILFSLSLVTTASKGDWSRRYFEGRIFAPVPAELVNELAVGPVETFITCNEVNNISDLFKACLMSYFESKGYDLPMLTTGEWKGGIKLLDKFMATEDMKPVFECEIYDLGSANKPMNIKRWADDIDMPPMYWKSLRDACLHFRKKAFDVGYLKSMGKQVRWF